MKRIIFYRWLISCFLLVFVSCEIDNYGGPDASFSGSIKDVDTRELVGTDIQNGSAIRAYELGWETMAAQTWVIKQTGEFQNDMVFAARYNLEFVNGNFFPFTVENFEIKKGKNTHDFEVTPYIRIQNTRITHDTGSKQIIATFTLEKGKPEVSVNSIRLYAFTDIHVGEQVKFTTKGSAFSEIFSPAASIDGKTYTLRIDLEENADLFKYSQNYYFRIGALAYVQNVGTIRHNYSELIQIAL